MGEGAPKFESVPVEPLKEEAELTPEQARVVETGASLLDLEQKKLDEAIDKKFSARRRQGRLGNWACTALAMIALTPTDMNAQGWLDKVRKVADKAQVVVDAGVQAKRETNRFKREQLRLQLQKTLNALNFNRQELQNQRQQLQQKHSYDRQELQAQRAEIQAEHGADIKVRDELFRRNEQSFRRIDQAFDKDLFKLDNGGEVVWVPVETPQKKSKNSKEAEGGILAVPATEQPSFKTNQQAREIFEMLWQETQNNLEIEDLNDRRLQDILRGVSGRF